MPYCLRYRYNTEPKSCQEIPIRRDFLILLSTFRIYSIFFLIIFILINANASEAQIELQQFPDYSSERLSKIQHIFVKHFNIEGNTVFSSEELAGLASKYENRQITSEEMQALRRELASYYAEKGYITTGVIIPDQKITGGIVTLRVVEVRLTQIEISGNKWLRTNYIKARLKSAVGKVININKLQQKLVLLQTNPLIKQIKAELKPGASQGEATLKVTIEENRPYNAGVELSNTRPPSSGGGLARFFLVDQNVTGNGDEVDASVGLTEGIIEYDVSYTVPISAEQTLLKLEARRDQVAVTEKPFNNLNILDIVQTYGVTLSQLFYRVYGREFRMGLTGEYRMGESSLLGTSFPFDPGLPNGKANVAALRWFQEYVDRGQNQVIAARSTLSFGLDAFGATVNSEGPSGEFFSWLGQFHWIRKLDRSDWQLVCRTDVQISKDPLLTMEKFAVGGMDSVRGYRTDRLVRDNGLASSIELRIPIYRNSKEEVIMQLAPFFDFGASWNTGFPTPEPETISSAGVGLRWAATEKIQFEVYGGVPFRDFQDNHKYLQDLGVHIRMIGTLF